MSERPLILISNDDGFQSQGIQELTRLMCSLGRVVVLAPDGPRSAVSCAITTRQAVSLTTLRQTPDLQILTCSGTPSDCIKLALEEVLPCKPSLVVSGINHGDNTSVNTHYSGTLGAVKEACMKGVSAIGFSLCSFDATCDFSPFSSAILHIARHVLVHPLPPDVYLNVNFPKTDCLKGMRLCRTARGAWKEKWVPGDEAGTFLLTGIFRNLEPDATDTDCWALSQDMAAITPMTLDGTHYSSFSLFTALQTT